MGQVSDAIQRGTERQYEQGNFKESLRRQDRQLDQADKQAGIAERQISLAEKQDTANEPRLQEQAQRLQEQHKVAMKEASNVVVSRGLSQVTQSYEAMSALKESMADLEQQVTAYHKFGNDPANDPVRDTEAAAAEIAPIEAQYNNMKRQYDLLAATHSKNMKALATNDAYKAAVLSSDYSNDAIFQVFGNMSKEMSPEDQAILQQSANDILAADSYAREVALDKQVKRSLKAAQGEVDIKKNAEIDTIRENRAYDVWITGMKELASTGEGKVPEVISASVIGALHGLSGVSGSGVTLKNTNIKSMLQNFDKRIKLMPPEVAKADYVAFDKLMKEARDVKTAEAWGDLVTKSPTIADFSEGSPIGEAALTVLKNIDWVPSSFWEGARPNPIRNSLILQQPAVKVPTASSN